MHTHPHIYDAAGILHCHAFELFQCGMDGLSALAIDNEDDEHTEEKYSCSEIHKLRETPINIGINA